MMQPCASAAKLRSGGPILFLGMLMLISAAAVPLALILRRVKLGGSAPVGH
jgi:hypothetical protein